VIVQEFAGSENRIPVYADLYVYLSRHGDNQNLGKTVGSSSEDSRVDEAVRAFAVRVVSRSRRALSHAIELKQLSERFSATQIDALSPSARIKFFGLLRVEAEALFEGTSQLRAELQPIFFATESNRASINAGEISSDGLMPAIERLYKLVLTIDEQIRTAFAVSTDGSTTPAMKAPQFRQSLVVAEKIAEGIQQVAAKESRGK
jgi:hypothetical protein